MTIRTTRCFLRRPARRSVPPRGCSGMFGSWLYGSRRCIILPAYRILGDMQGKSQFPRATLTVFAAFTSGQDVPSAGPKPVGLAKDPRVGSGVVLSAGGYIVANAPAVYRSQKITVTFRSHDPLAAQEEGPNTGGSRSAIGSMRSTARPSERLASWRCAFSGRWPAKSCIRGSGGKPTHPGSAWISRSSKGPKPETN